MKNEEKGIYIHIPFCKQKCFYCDFISFANRENIIKDYFQLIVNKLDKNDIKKLISKLNNNL